MENANTRGVWKLAKNQFPITQTPRKEKRTWKNVALEAILIGAAAVGGMYLLAKAYESGQNDVRARQEGREEPAKYEDNSLPNGIEPNGIEPKRIDNSKPEAMKNYKTNDFAKDDDKTLLARMLFGEARNCSEKEKVAIAYTAINRAKDGKKWNGESVKESILSKKFVRKLNRDIWQYSCFNDGDPNREKMKDPIKYDAKNFIECLKVADRVISGEYKDTANATHYHTPAVSPKWKDSLKMKSLGRVEKSKHLFYREA